MLVLLVQVEAIALHSWYMMSLLVMQTVDFGESGPIRCSQCKAYMCPHMQFMDRGRKFKCCFCNGVTATPLDYICNTGVDGRRHDADDRPELCRGSVEFLASREYMVWCHSHRLAVLMMLAAHHVLIIMC